ncbi:MAG: helix-turn-helix domain-containing protein [Bacillota bacterium]
MLGFQYTGDTPGARLRKARLAKNMTIADLVYITGLGKPTIYNLEADKTTARPPCLRTLASALDVPIAYLGKYDDLPEGTLGQRIKKARLYHDLTYMGSLYHKKKNVR